MPLCFANPFPSVSGPLGTGSMCVASPADEPVCETSVPNGPAFLQTCTPSIRSLFFIRPFDGADYHGISLVHNSLFPHRPLSRGEIQFDDVNRDSRCVLQRWVGKAGERWAGFAELTQSSETYSPNRFQFRVCVLPEFEGNGLEERLLGLVLKAFRRQRGVSLRSLVPEDQRRLMSVLERSGFGPSMRFQDKILNLGEPNLETAGGNLLEPPRGIAVKTLREFRFDPDAHRRLFVLENELRQSAPYPEDMTMRLDFFERGMMGHPGLLSDGYFIAMEGDRCIGVSALYRRDGNDIAYVWLTGVLNDYRKKGIAGHLKALSLRYAREAGFRSVITRNEENNQPINDLNAKLGFKVISSWMNWRRIF